MATYISILRGINVSGHNLIKMDDLRNVYTSLGFQNIATYVQSGNIIFTVEDTALHLLEQRISQQIQKVFGFVVPVIVLTAIHLKHIIDNNPFLQDPHKDESFMHVTFLSARPNAYNKEIIESKKQKGEEIRFSDSAIYLYCPNGYGKTKLNNNFLETKLKVPATTRNWKTTNELYKMAQHIK